MAASPPRETTTQRPRSILGGRAYLAWLRTGDQRMAESRALAEFPRIDRALCRLSKINYRGLNLTTKAT